MKTREVNTVIVYLRNKTINPSGYYRVYQYTKNIKNQNFKYRELVSNNIYYSYHFNNNILNKIRYIGCIFIRSFFYLIIDSLLKDSIVIINRETCPRKCLFLQRIFLSRLCKNNKIIWDFDDDILENGEISLEEWNILKKYSDSIIISSPYLFNLMNGVEKKRITLLNTTDGDFQYTNDLLEKRILSMKDSVNLVWIATSSNIVNLESVLSELDEYAMHMRNQSGKKVSLCCVCNTSVFAQTKYLKIENVKWSRQNALSALQKAHIGIMPLIDNKYSRGKGGFKLIQYMAAGLPMIASPVGINNEIVKDNIGKLPKTGEWLNAIDSICSSMEIWKEYAVNSRKEWENKYSYENVLERWREKLKR